MGRGGKKIYKHNERGKLVRIYASVGIALKEEHMSRYQLFQAMESKALVDGHRFSMEEPAEKPKKKVVLVRAIRREHPWEGADGFFDIDAWARECIQP